MREAPRKIWLCADDYGIAPGVNRAIRELIARGRLNATSVMMPVRAIGGEEADALDTLNAGETRAAIGLHVTLTGHFKPMSDGFAPTRDGHFLSIGQMMRAGAAGRLKLERLVDRNRHADAGVRGGLRTAARFRRRPSARASPAAGAHGLPPGRRAKPRPTPGSGNAAARHRRCICRASRDCRSTCSISASAAGRSSMGIKTNPAFAGVYDFGAKADFAAIFPRFLTGLPDGGLIMCHPGFVDAELKAADKLTQPREREFAFFNSDHFPRLLASHGVALAKPSGNGGAAA